jgi:hypothetical protein
MKMVSFAQNVSGSYAHLCIMVLEACFLYEVVEVVSEAEHEFLISVEETFCCIIEFETVRVWKPATVLSGSDFLPAEALGGKNSLVSPIVTLH